MAWASWSCAWSNNELQLCSCSSASDRLLSRPTLSKSPHTDAMVSGLSDARLGVA